MVDNITNLNNTNNFSVKSQTEMMMTDVGGILGSTYLYVHYPNNIQYICTSFRNR
jgi:hypothetical protein